MRLGANHCQFAQQQIAGTVHVGVTRPCPKWFTRGLSRASMAGGLRFQLRFLGQEHEEEKLESVSGRCNCRKGDMVATASSMLMNSNLEDGVNIGRQEHPWVKRQVEAGR